MSAALCCAFVSMPAKATWTLNFVGSGTQITTTDTYNCYPGYIPDITQCPATTTDQGTFAFNTFGDVDDFTGSIPYVQQLTHDSWFTGTLNFVNGSLFGTNLSYGYQFSTCRFGQTYGCTDVRKDGSAPTFAVHFVRAYGSPAPVPEPATWAMMLAGFGLAGAAIRKRTSPVAI